MGQLEKEKIRTEVRKKLNAMTEKEVVSRSICIFNKLKSIKSFVDAKEVFTFIGTKYEPRTELLIAELLNKKIVYVPKCLNNGEMKAVRIYSLSDLKVGKFGIMEPKEIGLNDDFGISGKAITIVPGYSFDFEGNRIGRGKGYYDKWFFKNKGKTISIGVCFDFQLFDFIPSDNWDIKVDAVITDKRSIFFNIL